MAFTTEQEETLKLIISAFENGKRLSDLPLATGTNPYKMTVEVLDEDGESKKAALASLLPYAEESCAYGVEFDTTISSPTCTRIGNTDLHKSLPIQSRMRGCLLDDDGKVVEYLDPNDWTGNDRTGLRGQVMVEIPMHYRKFETEGTKRRVPNSQSQAMMLCLRFMFPHTKQPLSAAPQNYAPWRTSMRTTEAVTITAALTVSITRSLVALQHQSAEPHSATMPESVRAEAQSGTATHTTFTRPCFGCSLWNTQHSTVRQVTTASRHQRVTDRAVLAQV